MIELSFIDFGGGCGELLGLVLSLWAVSVFVMFCFCFVQDDDD